MILGTRKRLRVSLSLFLFLMTITTTVHYWINKNSVDNKQILTDTTKLPGIVRSITYFEPRFIEYKDYSTTFIPGITDIDSMDQVYE